MSIQSVPKDLRNLRSCLLCSLIKTFDQFLTQGCDNCEQYLAMKGQTDRVYECTSSNFDGIISMLQPKDSWVAKWQKIERKKKGVYAVSVSGELPKEYQNELKEYGVGYRPSTRDRT